MKLVEGLVAINPAAVVDGSCLPMLQDLVEELHNGRRDSYGPLRLNATLERSPTETHGAAVEVTVWLVSYHERRYCYR